MKVLNLMAFLLILLIYMCAHRLHFWTMLNCQGCLKSSTISTKVSYMTCKFYTCLQKILKHGKWGRNSVSSLNICQIVTILRTKNKMIKSLKKNQKYFLQFIKVTSLWACSFYSRLLQGMNSKQAAISICWPIHCSVKTWEHLKLLKILKTQIHDQKLITPWIFSLLLHALQCLCWKQNLKSLFKVKSLY